MSTQLKRTPNHRAALKIRRAKDEDKAHVIRFINSSTDLYRDIVAAKDLKEHAVTPEWADRNFEIREFYIGHDEEINRPVGTITFQTFGEYAYLGYVYVDNAMTGRGYGRQLLDFAVAQARQRGLKGLALLAHPQADWAVRTYERYGFVQAECEKERVLAWNNAALTTYYEEGFHLFIYALDSGAES